MITVKVNLKNVVGNLKAKLAKLADREYLLRPVAFDAMSNVSRRIHTDGKASDGNAIGTYTPGYMAVRTGIFKTNDTFKSGPRKGQIKPTGVFTKGINKGQQRPKYNRSSDPAVVISLTRELENGYALIATEKGYGIGFPNPHNYDKSQWVQATYNKRIFDLTDDEYQKAIDQINDLTSKAISEQ